jgi:hypothetical protein
MKRKRIAITITFIVFAIALVGNMPAAVANMPTDFGCTLGGITGSATFQHEVFIGQTMDNPWWNTRHTVWVIQPENGYKYLGTKAYIWGFWTGINEKGFSWAGAAVTPNDAPDPSGINRFDIGPMLLEKCVTVYDAINILQNVKRSADFPCRNAIMADALGNLALVEISYSKINVATLTRDGYVASTNHYASDQMWNVNKNPPGPTSSSIIRLNRGNEWFANWFAKKTPKGDNKMRIEDLFSPKDGFWSYVYEVFQDNLRSGPGTVGVMQPMQLTYWFSYGWPGGNLPTEENKFRQICQDMTWGAFIPFYLPEMIPGQYTTELGQLTPLGIQYVVSHFSSKQQGAPAWVNYQSDDPMKPYYKPAEDIVSPDGYAPKDNPYGPEGYIGTWTSGNGFVPLGPPYPVP